MSRQLGRVVSHWLGRGVSVGKTPASTLLTFMRHTVETILGEAPQTVSGPLSWRVRKPALRLLGIFGAIALALGLWRLVGRGDASSMAFETQVVRRGVVERSISATGSVKALVTVEVGTQLSGLISEMKFDFNDRVKKGDLLAVIDQAPYKAKVASAAANLAIAKADIGLREAGMAKVQRQLEQFERDSSRYKALAPRGATSPQQIDRAETQSATTRHDLSTARAQLESAKAAVALRQAELERAQIDLDLTLIRSPIDGVVVDRRMQPGQTVAALYQTPILYQIAQDLSQIQITAQVDEADVGSIRRGAHVTFTVDAYPEEIFSGDVEQVRLAATKTSGVVTYTVIIRAQNPGQRLFPDMTATVRIVTDQRKDVLVASNEALRFRLPSGDTRPQGPSVIALVDGEPQRRSLRIGLRGDSAAEIIDGDVKEGDAVIVGAKNTAGQR